MPTPTIQLLASTFHLTDGTTTIWNFYFSGGYIDKGHIKAYYETPAGIRTIITVTEAMVVGAYQLQITPVIASGNTLVIYRDTPKTAPLVDFTDGSGLSEIALDTTAKQAVFIGAEAFDNPLAAAYYAQQASGYATASSLSAKDSAFSAGVAASNALNSAGGFRNRIINGGMQVAQRGVSITPAHGSYLLDRWITSFNGTGSVHLVVQQTFPSGTGPDGATKYLSYAQSVPGSGATFIALEQRIEYVETLHGKTVTLSFWLRNNAATALPQIICRQYFGSTGSAIVDTTVATTVATTSSFAKYTYTFTVPSIVGKTVSGGDDYTSILLLMQHNSIQTVDVTNVQLELGSVATPFEQRPIGMELALCQRYYDIVSVNTRGYAVGYTGAVETPCNWHQPMRAIPTVVLAPGVRGNVATSSILYMNRYGARHVITAAGAGDTCELMALVAASAEL